MMLHMILSSQSAEVRQDRFVHLQAKHDPGKHTGPEPSAAKN